MYFATAAAREGEINYYVGLNGYTDDQKTFITGRMVCCTDPIDPEKKITPHFAYYLLQNKEAAEKFFTEMGIGKPPAQTE